MRRILLLILLIFGFSNLCFCQNQNPRYISLAPSTTEILFALGLDNQIVGVSSFCNYPQEVKNKKVVGSFSEPNIEEIVSLKPDYIFCTGLEQAPIITKLRHLNLKVYVADPKNIKELFDSIIDIAKITGREEIAKNLISMIAEQIDAVKLKTKDISLDKRPKVFIEIWHNPLLTAGKNSFVDELITLAGGINIASKVKRPYSIFSSEEVIKQNPDYIIITYMDKEMPKKMLERRFGWNQISAVKNDRVYNDINSDLLLRPGPRIVEGLKELYKKLHN